MLKNSSIYYSQARFQGLDEPDIKKSNVSIVLDRRTKQDELIDPLLCSSIFFILIANFFLPAEWNISQNVSSSIFHLFPFKSVPFPQSSFGVAQHIELASPREGGSQLATTKTQMLDKLCNRRISCARQNA
jgi:hypothetical protein